MQTKVLSKAVMLYINLNLNRASLIDCWGLNWCNCHILVFLRNKTCLNGETQKNSQKLARITNKPNPPPYLLLWLPDLLPQCHPHLSLHEHPELYLDSALLGL